MFRANGSFPQIFSKAPQGVGDHEARSIGWKPLGPRLICRVYRYPCFPLHIRTVPVRLIVEVMLFAFLQNTCMIDMPFRRMEDSTGITHLRSQYTTACWLEACLLAGSRSAGAMVFQTGAAGTVGSRAGATDCGGSGGCIAGAVGFRAGCWWR